MEDGAGAKARLDRNGIGDVICRGPPTGDEVVLPAEPQSLSAEEDEP